MTTIVMNTLNGFVSHYDWTFQSITPTHAGDANALYLLGGDTDGDALPIAATFMGATTNLGSSKKKAITMGYLSMTGDADSSGKLRVAGASGAWEYTFAVAAAGQSRAQPGMGIRENRIGLGFRNVAGADFRIDRIEAVIPESTTRRTGA